VARLNNLLTVFEGTLLEALGPTGVVLPSDPDGPSLITLALQARTHSQEFRLASPELRCAKEHIGD
jgi:hypothetical protein